MDAQLNYRWLLPDGIEEFLPPEARAIETLRQRMLQLYHLWGYDLVMPAMIEYRDSLLTGTAHSLQRKTFSLVDHSTGRLLGLRSDMTPQVARIYAHRMGGKQISRLCYCGHLVHSRTDGLNPSRSPLQIGAEIFGINTVAADIEVVSLMIETLQNIPLQPIVIDLGHVGIFREIVSEAGMSKESEQQLFDMLQRKSLPELHDYLNGLGLNERHRNWFSKLAVLNGSIDMLQQAKTIFSDAPQACTQAIEHIESVGNAIQQRYPEVAIHCDLSELRGYEYHTGLVFSALLPGQGSEIARGGRYDEIGEAFGVTSPATGFSADLTRLFRLASLSEPDEKQILAPNESDSELLKLIDHLRAEGHCVKLDLTDGMIPARQQNCDRVIHFDEHQWVVTKI